MIKFGDSYALERAELIRINRLVRGHIDMPAFYDWYDSISKAEQVTLAFSLHEFALQTGFQMKVWDDAVRNSGVSPDLAEFIRTLIADGLSGKLYSWLLSVSDGDQRMALPLLVQVFGESESAVMAIETEDSCNHWWHRDLLNPAVLADLMSNPDWDATSPKDDPRKGLWE